MLNNNFDELIRFLGAQITSGRMKDVLDAIEQLEDLSAVVETKVREDWQAWRQKGGPVGAERLQILAQRSVVGRLLVEARHTARTLHASLWFTQGSISFALTEVAAAKGLSFREVSELLVNALTEESSNYYFWPIDIYDDFLIYEQTEKSQDYSGTTKLYRRDYQIGIDEVVAFGDPVEVEKKIQYVDAIRIERGGDIRFIRQVK